MIDHDGTFHDSVPASTGAPADGTVPHGAAHSSVGGPASTGHAQVDDVLRTLASLPELPVDQHVVVFEAAHAGLREALSSAGPAAPAAVDRG